MTNCLRCLAGVLLLSIGGWAEAADFYSKVIAVLDGDTLLVLQRGNPVKIRLAEIDAPEKSQPYGAASQESLAELVMGKQIRVISRAVDDYGRLVATVHLNGINVNQEQVQRGMAWEYSRYHSNHNLMALQRAAQQARRGLWAKTGAIPPSQWRKQHPATVAPTHTPAAVIPGCGNKKHCAEMSSCEEARYYVTQCGLKSLDGNGDGVPCERLCGGRK